MNYYDEKLKEGMSFESFIQKVFFEELAINLDFTVYDNQTKIGETLQGIEVKFDNRYKETGNLYIEVAEKSNPDNPNYIKSGVFRDDNTWLYAIGNYEKIFIFAKKTLVQIKDKFTPVVTPTSMGFLLPNKDAEFYCAKIITTKPAGGTVTGNEPV
jgi:hypothetical protein